MSSKNKLFFTDEFNFQINLAEIVAGSIYRFIDVQSIGGYEDQRPSHTPGHGIILNWEKGDEYSCIVDSAHLASFDLIVFFDWLKTQIVRKVAADNSAVRSDERSFYIEISGDTYEGSISSTTSFPDGNNFNVGLLIKVKISYQSNDF